MKAVIANVPEHILASGRRTGADRWDEMWEGVLHMAPSPNREHQDFELALAIWLRQKWAEPNGCRVYHQINVSEAGTWPNNYRIPDLVLLTPSRFHIDRNEYFDGGPDAVTEIHSPGEKAHGKLPFYASVGVREVVIIDRDTKEPEIFERIGVDYQLRNAHAGEWVNSSVAGFELRAASGDKLEIRIAGHDDTRALLP